MPRNIVAYLPRCHLPSAVTCEMLCLCFVLFPSSPAPHHRFERPEFVAIFSGGVVPQGWYATDRAFSLWLPHVCIQASVALVSTVVCTLHTFVPS